MTEQKNKQIALDIMQEEIRKGKLIRYKDVLETLPEVVDTVHINRNELKKAIERCLTTTNPINSFLKLFGMQIIKKEKTIENLIEASDVSIEIGANYSGDWLTIDKKQFATIVQNAANQLADLENKANQTYDDEKKRGDDLFSKYEKQVQAYNELKYDADMNERMVAERIQYILSMDGQAETEKNNQLIELLKDLDIDVYWNSDGTSFSETVMFTEYAINDETMQSVKPCLVRNGQVYLKGARLIKK